MSPVSSDPGSYHHGNLRASLVRAAAELLEEGGLAGLSLREVAKRVGVSHAAPYRHFRDKQMLLQAIAQEGFVALTDSVAAAVAAHPEDYARQIECACYAYQRSMIEHPHRARLMFGGVLDPATWSEALWTASVASLMALREVIRAGQVAGVFREGSTRDLAMTLWCAAHGFCMLVIESHLQGVSREGESVEDLRSAIHANLMRTLLAD